MSIFIGIGSNLGARENNISRALAFLEEHNALKVEKVSSIIETVSQGGPPQPKYLNAAVKLKTDLPPKDLLNVLQNIETTLGRVRSVKNGPRIIDLDILLYGDKIINIPGLNIPHPRMWERDFVMIPLIEIIV